MELRIARQTRLQLRERLLGRGDRVGPHLFDGLTVGDPPPVLQGEDALYGDDLSGGELAPRSPPSAPASAASDRSRYLNIPAAREGVP